MSCFSTQPVPAWERAEFTARLISKARALNQFLGLRLAFRRADAVFVILDPVPESDTHSRIEETCRSMHVSCHIIPAAQSLCLQGEYFGVPSELFSRVKELIARAKRVETLLALTGGNYWVMANPNAVHPYKLCAGPVQHFRSTSLPVQYAIELLSALNVDALPFLINGEWLVVKRHHTFAGISERIHPLPKRILPSCLAEEASRIEELAGKMRGQNALNTFASAMTFNEAGRPIFNWAQILRGLQPGV